MQVSRKVQSAFFDQNQVTIHLMVAYYKERMENEEPLVKPAIIGITDDHQKGALRVKMFEKEAITIIEREKGKNLRTVHEFKGGCASQYKGKISFFDISKQKEPDVTHNVFETSHGKSVCDGLGAVVKGSCHHAVISGKEILGTAQDAMKYCEKKVAGRQKGHFRNKCKAWDQKRIHFHKLWRC